MESAVSTREAFLAATVSRLENVDVYKHLAICLLLIWSDIQKFSCYTIEDISAHFSNSPAITVIAAILLFGCMHAMLVNLFFFSPTLSSPSCLGSKRVVKVLRVRGTR